MTAITPDSIDLPESFRSRFHPLEILGEGAYGLVIRARQESLDRVVVVKILKKFAGNESVNRARFRQEAQFLSETAHPNLLEILDYEIHPDHSFMVYPDNQGIPLRQVIPGGKTMPIPDLIRVLRDCLQGLSFLHQRGIVHRDIKPANVLLKEDGTWIIIDLGLARSAGPGAGLTATGHTPGTPLYMSPQLLQGEEPTPSEDLYALGAMAYELATGVSPFWGDTLSECIQNQIMHHPSPLHEVRPEVPLGLSQLIGNLLEKQREDRVASCEAALQRLSEVIPSPSPRASPRKSATKLASVSPSGPVQVSLTGHPARFFRLPQVGALLLAATAACYFAFSPTPEPSSPVAPTTPVQDWLEGLEKEFSERAPSLSRDPGQWGVVFSSLPHLSAFYQSSNRLESLHRASPEVRKRLASLGEQFHHAGLPDPFRALLRCTPSLQPLKMEDPELRRIHLPRDQELVFSGWSGTAFAAFRDAQRRLADRSRDLERMLRGLAPLHPVPEGLRALLFPSPGPMTHAFPVQKAPLEGLAPFFWGKSGETRRVLAEWLGEEVDLFHSLCSASHRALLAEELPPSQFLPLALYWQGRLSPLYFSPASLVPKAWFPGGSSRSPGAALYEAVVRSRLLLAKGEIWPLSREEVARAFESFGRALDRDKESDAEEWIYQQYFSLLSLEARQHQRPDLLMMALKQARDVLVPRHGLATHCLEEVAISLEDVRSTPEFDHLGAFRQELTHYPEEIRTMFQSSGPNLTRPGSSRGRQFRRSRLSINPVSILERELGELLEEGSPRK